MAQPIRKTPSDIDSLADAIGGFIEYFGFKRIHGRIWLLLFLSRRPMAAVELSERLRASKTLLSFSIADLLRYGVIEEAGRGPRRTIYYRANPDVADAVLRVLRTREREMLADIAARFGAVEKARRSAAATGESGRSGGTSDHAYETDPGRLRELGALVRGAQAALEALLALAPRGEEFAAQLGGLAEAFGESGITREPGLGAGPRPRRGK